MPLQCAFLAYLGTTDSNVTGNGETVVLGAGNALTEVYDQNGDFNTNGTFTAPVTGRYCFSAAVRLSDLTSSHTQGWLQVQTSNDNYLYLSNVANLRTVGNEVIINATVQADMDAADTANIRINVQNGTTVVDITANDRDTFFAGYLMC
jgi:hypothetical protein